MSECSKVALLQPRCPPTRDACHREYLSGARPDGAERKILVYELPELAPDVRSREGPLRDGGGQGELPVRVVRCWPRWEGTARETASPPHAMALGALQRRLPQLGYGAVDRCSARRRRGHPRGADAAVTRPRHVPSGDVGPFRSHEAGGRLAGRSDLSRPRPSRPRWLSPSGGAREPLFRVPTVIPLRGEDAHVCHPPGTCGPRAGPCGGLHATSGTLAFRALRFSPPWLVHSWRKASEQDTTAPSTRPRKSRQGDSTPRVSCRQGSSQGCSSPRGELIPNDASKMCPSTAGPRPACRPVRRAVRKVVAQTGRRHGLPWRARPRALSRTASDCWRWCVGTSAHHPRGGGGSSCAGRMLGLRGRCVPVRSGLC